MHNGKNKHVSMFSSAESLKCFFSQKYGAKLFQYVLMPSVCNNYLVLQMEPGRQYPLSDLKTFYQLDVTSHKILRSFF